MSLMRININKTTNPGLTAGNNVVIAHSLGAAPDIVRIRYLATIAVANATDWYGMAIPVDATNVTVINHGSTASPNFEVVAIRLHTLIQ